MVIYKDRKIYYTKKRKVFLNIFVYGAVFAKFIFVCKETAIRTELLNKTL